MKTQREINLTILSELKKIANEVFANEIYVKDGTYTSYELSNMWLTYYNVDDPCLLTRTISVESFKCAFDRLQVFNLIYKFERMLNVNAKDKTRFVRCS